MRRTVSSRAYGECARSGERVPLKELVKDGQLRGLLVQRRWRDPKHPQELPYRARPEKHDIPAPEISAPPDEGADIPALAFDATGKLL